MSHEIEEMSLNKKAWFRYLARMIDMTFGALILGVMIGMILGVISGFLGIQDLFFSLPEFAITFIILAIYFMIEARIITTYATTPFKKFFGITIRHNSGEKLAYGSSLQRNFTLWFKGLALSIPLVSLVTLIYAYIAYTDNGFTSWDKSNDVSISFQPISQLRLILGVIIWIIAMSITIFMMKI